jgi:putative lipase involved disintegration of autophagic bodies
MSKYTFVEFIAAQEGEDFNVIEPDNLEWAKRFVGYMGMCSNLIHIGDCTKENVSCILCVYEVYLKEYREYYFSQEENGRDQTI